MPVEPNDYALIDVAQYLTYIGETDPNATGENKDHLQTLINMISQRISRYCGRKFRYTADATEKFAGDGTSLYRVINWPLISVSLLEEWNPGTQDWDELTTTQYPRSVDTDHHVVHLNQEAKFTCRNYNAYRITYTYGWALGNVNDDLVLATCQLVQRAVMKSEKDMEGTTSRTIADQTTSFDLGQWPKDVLMILGEYVRRLY